MRRSFSRLIGAALVCSCGSAFAQGGDLAGVTMRVLDDLSDVDAVVLELDTNRGGGEESAEGDGRRARADEAQAADDAERAPGAGVDEDPAAERGDGKALHDSEDDERSEGKLEDNDVERPAAPTTP